MSQSFYINEPTGCYHPTLQLLLVLLGLFSVYESEVRIRQKGTLEKDASSAFTANLLTKATKISCLTSSVSLLVQIFYNKVLTVSEIWGDHVPGYPSICSRAQNTLLQGGGTNHRNF